MIEDTVNILIIAPALRNTILSISPKPLDLKVTAYDLIVWGGFTVVKSLLPGCDNGLLASSTGGTLISFSGKLHD